MDLDFYYSGCNSTTLIPPDATSDANGLLIWSDNIALSFAPNGCGVFIVPYYQQCGDTYYSIVGTDVDEDGGYRNMDEDGDSDVDLQDLGTYFQPAFTSGEPAFRGDFNRDDLVAIQDLALFQAHFQACNTDDARGVLSTGSVSLAENSDILIYAHITPVLPVDITPPVVLPNQAVTSVGAIGTGDRHMTVLLFAQGYDGLGGIHVKLNWPQEWELEDLDEDLLPGQLLGYTGDGLHEMQYAAVFNCLSGGEARAIARFDVLVTRPGSVTLDPTMPPQIVNCEAEMRVLDVTEADLAEPSKSREGVTESASIAQITQLGSAGAVSFEVSSVSPEPLDVRVYDVFGRLVKMVETGVINGTRVVTWDGGTDRGTPVPSGVYFVDLQVGALRRVERTLIMR